MVLCRTAPATPGLLDIYLIKKFYEHQLLYCLLYKNYCNNGYRRICLKPKQLVAIFKPHPSIKGFNFFLFFSLSVSLAYSIPLPILKLTSKNAACIDLCYETLKACASISVSKLCQFSLPYLVNLVKTNFLFFP